MTVNWVDCCNLVSTIQPGDWTVHGPHHAPPVDCSFSCTCWRKLDFGAECSPIPPPATFPSKAVLCCPRKFWPISDIGLIHGWYNWPGCSANQTGPPVVWPKYPLPSQPYSTLIAAFQPWDSTAQNAVKYPHLHWRGLPRAMSICTWEGWQYLPSAHGLPAQGCGASFLIDPPPTPSGCHSIHPLRTHHHYA